MVETKVASDSGVSAPWTATVEEALASCGSRPEGLEPHEAERRLREVGPNRLPEPKGRSPLLLFFSQFTSFLSLLLLGAALLALWVGDLKDAVVVTGVVLFNAVLGFVQEYRAENAVAALRRMLPRLARVRRGGAERVVAAEELVAGDVALLEAGDRVPADGRWITATSLEVDESALTGESLPSAKDPGPLADPELALGDRDNMSFMNTVITRGRGELLITATGAGTETGRVAALLHQAPEDATPLQRQVDALGKRLALIAGAVVVAVTILELLRGTPPVAVAMEAVAIAVAAIPEGLPAVVTVTLAVGVQRMARRRAIVRRMSAVETLGSTTDICSDKTGTLTVNQMTAREVALAGHHLAVTGEGYGLEGAVGEGAAAPPQLPLLLQAAALCNDSSVRDGQVLGDPTEGALWVLAAKGGLDVDGARKEAPRVAEVPFDSARKFSATVHQGGALFAKGAPDVLLERCTEVQHDQGARPLDAAERARVQEAQETLAANGLRVLALATRQVAPPELPQDPDALADEVRGLVLVGLVGLQDPPRAEAREAIALCARAGIRVRMITGDHAATGLAVARALGIEGEAISGRELDTLSDEDLAERIATLGVLARVSPEHKLRVVDALRARGRVVAMIGDGVNDAPALRRADIGVAMGKGGTDVAREASRLILADDNFATIVGAVQEGRTIYDNIVRFLRFQLSTNVGALVTVFFAPVLGLPPPFTPLQILWVNLIMDGPPAMALGLEPPQADVMAQPPRDPRAPMLTARRFAVLAFLGLVMGAGTLSVLASATAGGATLAKATTLAFTTFVLFQLFNAFNARFERRSALGRHSLRNYRLWIALGAVLVLQGVAVHWAPLQSILGTTALTLGEWGLCAGVAASILVLEEGRKVVARRLWA